MNNKIAKQLFIKNYWIITGITLGVYYWFLESSIDVFIVGENSLIDRIFTSDTKEIMTRLFVLSIILVGSYLLHLSTIKQRITAEAMENAKDYAKSLINSSLDMIIATNLDSKIIEFNAAAQRTFGYSKAEAIGKPIDFLYAKSSDLINVRKEMTKFKKFEGEIINKRKNGDKFYSFISASSLQDSKGKIVGVMGISRDITERKIVEEKLKIAHDKLEHHVKERTLELEQKIIEHRKSEEKILHMAYHDQLTGLPNRRLLIDRLEHVLDRRQSKLAALLFLDLDRFKYINDTLGHLKGDEVLKEVAKRLNMCIRKSDTLARHGGDEFTILVQDLNRVEDIAKLTDRIFSLFNTPFHLKGQHVFVTTSIGVSIYPNDGEDAETLIKNADIALYKAKDEGRNTYQLFTSTLNKNAVKRVKY